MNDTTVSSNALLMDDTPAIKSFRRLAIITICAVYFLILVGATVRASGAGMGCPDWPTCFGSLIPPVSESQLPPNYQEIYADRGYAETRFNVVKTWTEYVNRLVGVTIGLLIMATAWRSLTVRRYDRRIMIASLAALAMVIYQGWLGSQVVASNLQPGMITVHMLMALAIVATLLYALARARRHVMAQTSVAGIDPRFRKWLYIVMALTLVQITMGIQIRELMDYLAHTVGAEREVWIEAQNWVFYVHRSFSSVVLFSNVWLVWMLWQSLGIKHSLTRLAAGVLAVIAVAILSGATLGHLGMPWFVQPTHLLCASLIFGLQFLLWMDYRHATGGSAAPAAA
jgi:heme a synthase